MRVKVQVSQNDFLVIIAGLCTVLLLVTVIPGSVSAQGPIEVFEEVLIDSSAGSVCGPGWQAVAGDMIVFVTDANGDTDIYGYDMSTYTKFRITDEVARQESVDISGENVVWMDERNGNWDIYGYNLGQDPEFQITNHVADQTWPVVDGNTVAWVDSRNGSEPYYSHTLGYELYGYDLGRRTEFRITGHAAPIFYPAISRGVIVWSDRRSGSWEVYSYDIRSGTETQITHGEASFPYLPAISNGIVVFDQRNLIQGTDLVGNPIFQVPTPLYFLCGHPAIDGNLVVWHEWFDGVCLYYPCPTTVVGYDFTARHRFLIPRGEHEAWYPAISGDVVVWRDQSSAFEIPSPPPSVYASRLLETVQLRANPSNVSPGDPITYTTIVAEETVTGTFRSITYTLSPMMIPHTLSLQATSGSYGYQPATRLITWMGAVSSATWVTITYSAQVSPTVSFGEHITTTAVVSDQTSVFTRTATTRVASRAYLPIIVRALSP